MAASTLAIASSVRARRTEAEGFGEKNGAFPSSSLFLRSCEILRPQPGDAESEATQPPPHHPPEFAQITEPPLTAGERGCPLEAAAESALCRDARLVSAARDGDAIEARMLLELSPALGRYSTFGGLNTPLHFATAKGHLDIVTMLLEKGTDVNARNYCGQTALMHACRHGHWEVVQMLLLFRCNVTRAYYLSGRTALHFAAHDGFVRCMLLVADFVPSVALEDIASCAVDSSDCQTNSGSSPNSSLEQKFNEFARVRYINKPADGYSTSHGSIERSLRLHAVVN